MGKIWDKLTELKPDPIALARRNAMQSEIAHRANRIVQIVNDVDFDPSDTSTVETELGQLWKVAQAEANKPQMRHI